MEAEPSPQSSHMTMLEGVCNAALKYGMCEENNMCMRVDGDEGQQKCVLDLPDTQEMCGAFGLEANPDGSCMWPVTTPTPPTVTPPAASTDDTPVMTAAELATMATAAAEQAQQSADNALSAAEVAVTVATTQTTD
tara:strand:- start:304 stop:711 length:408 start_codon:yes stop_codon:yes gene_type:complete